MEARARNILQAHPLYEGMTSDELDARVDLPLYLGQATVIEPGIFVSWMRPTASMDPENPGALERHLTGQDPTADDWLAKGPMLWLIDMVAPEGMDQNTVRDLLIQELVNNRRVVYPGETVCFRRNHGERIGYIIVPERAA